MEPLQKTGMVRSVGIKRRENKEGNLIMPTLHESHKYDDIINLPHHVSGSHPQMDIMDRAAQFSPFAALTGYEAAAKETQRLTQPKVELDESEKQLLDEKFHQLEAELSKAPVITVTYFVPDKRKEGGAYLTISGKVKKIDYFKKTLQMEQGEQLPFDDISDIQL